MSKYSHLKRRLSMERGNSCSFTFSYIEEILQFQLPRSASVHRAWWANDGSSHSHARSWLEAGWSVRAVDLAFGRVQFERTGHVAITRELRFESAKSTKPTVKARPNYQTKGVQIILRHAGQIALISCSKQKAATARSAKDLYTSSLFTKSRAFVETAKLPWFILSARHGLIAPDQIIEPYDETLNTMPIEGRRAWAHRVGAEIVGRLPRDSELLLFAGERYSEFLVPLLKRSSYLVVQPLKGLPLGRRLARLDEMRREI
jgi:hypothetical protein